MVDVGKLRARMAECNVSMANLSGQIGINQATLYRRFADSGECFTLAEAEKIGRALNLTVPEMNEIFFAEVVA